MVGGPWYFKDGCYREKCLLPMRQTEHMFSAKMNSRDRPSGGVVSIYAGLLPYYIWRSSYDLFISGVSRVESRPSIARPNSRNISHSLMAAGGAVAWTIALALCGMHMAR